MKYTGFIVLIVLLFYACGTTDKKSDHQVNRLLEKFKPYLHGIWVSKDYIDNIEKTKSPIKSSDMLHFVSEFSIDTTDLEGDSMHVGAAFGNHEGGDFILYFKEGHIPGCLATSLKGFETNSDTYELGFLIEGPDTLLVLHYIDNNIQSGSLLKYIKSSKTRSNGELDGLQYTVNNKLATGRYTVLDSTGNSTNVQLTTDGKIKGFKDFKTYYILTDFVAEPENITDQICLDIQTSKQRCYGFNIVADTISLFDPAKDEQDTLYKPGRILYRFIRQH